MQDIYQTFEFHKIKDEIVKYLKSERAKEDVLNLSLMTSYDDVSNSLKDLKEGITLVSKYSDLPLSPSINALNVINEAKKSGILSPRELNMISEDVKTSINILSFINKMSLLFPRIKKKTDEFFDLTNIKNEIDKVIAPSLLIKDEASSELAKIRKDIKKNEALLEKRITTIALSYTSYLNDGNATLRDGHLVLPVKTAYKNKVPGIIYDISDSGNTTFI